MYLYLFQINNELTQMSARLKHAVEINKHPGPLSSFYSRIIERSFGYGQHNAHNQDLNILVPLSSYT